MTGVHWLAFGVALLAAAPVALAAPLDPDAPPADLSPTSATLQQVLAAHKQAIGQAGASAGATTETWTLKRGDLTGTWKYLEAGDDYRMDETLGKLHRAEGSFHDQAWDQDYNGYTVLDTGLHRRDEINRKALAAASQGGSGVTLVGESAKPAAFVVKINPPGGRVEYRFYDKSTYQLVRKERSIDGLRVVTTYDDFRTRDGVTAPWHEHVTDGRPFNEEDFTLQSAQHQPSVDDAALRIPPDLRNPVTLEAPRVTLPAKIIADRVIVTVEIKGRKVNLQLDSGAYGILLDRSVADALKLEEFGRATGSTAGTYETTQALVPEMKLGKASLKDVVVDATRYVEWEDSKTPVAGLMGFDLIAGCVVVIDYQAGTVEALDPNTFSAPPGATALPIRLDDRVPVIAAHIGAATGEGFILDTGADRSVLFSAFVAAHKAETADQGLGEAKLIAFPFIPKAFGVGGEFHVRPVEVTSLRLGSITLPHWLFDATENAAKTFESEDLDGLIGQDVLRNFVVYLDYRHKMIYLTPNERFRQRWSLPPA